LGPQAKNGVVDGVWLTQKHGTYHAKPTAQPGWVQFRFPKLAAAAAVTFRFGMDNRYRPFARGGNPCTAAVGRHPYLRSPFAPFCICLFLF
jgi:hypothetical protein